MPNISARWQLIRCNDVNKLTRATRSSELTYYSDLFGPEVLLKMNVCYFAPSVPIMIFQVRLFCKDDI